MYLIFVYLLWFHANFTNTMPGRQYKAPEYPGCVQFKKERPKFPITEGRYISDQNKSNILLAQYVLQCKIEFFFVLYIRGLKSTVGIISII